MIARLDHLRRFPSVFLSLTGLRLPEFDTLLAQILPLLDTARQDRLSRPKRQRAFGAGAPSALSPSDQILLTVVWLRVYPTNEVLGYLFGVSDSTVSRTIARVLPLLADTGHDQMRMPDPGRKRRRSLDQLLKDTPGLAVVVDSFEQRVQRPRSRTEADSYYSGKKKQHTLKCQIAVDEETGKIVHLPASVKGRKADVTLCRQSGLIQALPSKVGLIGDKGYQGLGKDLSKERYALPRKKPRGGDYSAEDIAYNRAFSVRRIVAAHSIRRMRCYQSISQTDRHHRTKHDDRTAAIAGLANLQIEHRFGRAA